MDPRLDEFRVDLLGYCYRMLGSAFEAEDAARETVVRAWRGFDGYDENRAPLRSWLYAIATNVCLDLLRGARRRALAMDLGSPSRAGESLGYPLPAAGWIQPVPDARIRPAHGDPARLSAWRDTIRLPFVAALQRLPPRQRAVLILRDVLCFKGSVVAAQLNTSVASVTSALQRARSTLRAANAAGGPAPGAGIGSADGAPGAGPASRLDDAHRRLLARYRDAVERHDVEALVSLLHGDATMSMPPFAWWLRGRDEIREALLAARRPGGGARLLPTLANGSAAFGQYRSADGSGYRPFALVIVEVSGGLITDTVTYLDAERLFPLFDLPAELPGPGADELVPSAEYEDGEFSRAQPSASLV
ncbi:sigma-70 family RNA polymerase sigma factor [Rugosimonospora acidiphila]|uniref:Sigma-70 family RNA polymerase sigma factor n=1 Tax=Rugosimonospora acidiphila TaxID=556531 RepID=A0ABP9RWA0_9ACTN